MIFSFEWQAIHILTKDHIYCINLNFSFCYRNTVLAITTIIILQQTDLSKEWTTWTTMTITTAVLFKLGGMGLSEGWTRFCPCFSTAKGADQWPITAFIFQACRLKMASMLILCFISTKARLTQTISKCIQLTLWNFTLLSIRIKCHTYIFHHNLIIYMWAFKDTERNGIDNMKMSEDHKTI